MSCDADGAKAAQRVITLDGPAASGKSSVAARVADALGLPFVSSGLLYRAVTYLAQLEQLPLHDESQLMALLDAHQLRLEAQPLEPNRIILDGAPVSSEALHSDLVDAGVSAVAKHPAVRRWVDTQLRELPGAFVVEGRDMGTAVFPRAHCKFYLEAPVEVRAQRRLSERQVSLTELTKALSVRDTRDAAQLVPAPDALHIQTSELTLDEVVALVLSHLADRS